MGQPHKFTKENIRAMGTPGIAIMAGALILGVIHQLAAPLQQAQQLRIEKAELALFAPEITKEISIEPFTPALPVSAMHDSATIEHAAQALVTAEDTFRIQPQNISQPAYRVLKNNQVEAIIMTIVAPEGFDGPITLRLGIGRNGQITAARVVPPHHETSGWGDKIELSHSPWILQFDGKPQAARTTTITGIDLRLSAEAKLIALRTDGGEIDGISGATITSRAVASAINNALIYVRQNHQALFGEATDSRSTHE